MKGTLYVVATPLGNLEDVTLRALRVLKEVSLIAAEDTRHSRKLLTHYGIVTPVTSYYDQIETKKAPLLVERLARGESVALISDAGTPGIADPGYRLIRAAVDAGVAVVPVPGPSMAAAVLSVSGLPTNRFAFEGFVPARAAARRAFYAQLRTEPRTVVCFETGRRLPASLKDLAEILGERQIVVAREVTKWFEEFVRGRAPEIHQRIGDQPVRGEVTLVIAPPSEPVAVASDETVRATIASMRGAGMRAKDVARAVALETGRSRGEVYRMVVEDRE
jgi:16S rRNA (cytidine1402-2'-O)-methyltransferase